MSMQSLAVLLTPGSASNIANIVKGYAIAIGVAFAIWFAWRWWRTRGGEQAAERKTRALAIWGRHQQLALQHPDLADGRIGPQSTSAEVTRYRAFVASLLMSAAEILAIEPTDGWRTTIVDALGPHASYLSSPDFRAGSAMKASDEVSALVESVIRG